MEITKFWRDSKKICSKLAKSWQLFWEGSFSGKASTFRKCFEKWSKLIQIVIKIKQKMKL